MIPRASNAAGPRASCFLSRGTGSRGRPVACSNQNDAPPSQVGRAPTPGGTSAASTGFAINRPPSRPDPSRHRRVQPATSATVQKIDFAQRCRPLPWMPTSITTARSSPVGGDGFGRPAAATTMSPCDAAPVGRAAWQIVTVASRRGAAVPWGCRRCAPAHDPGVPAARGTVEASSRISRRLAGRSPGGERCAGASSSSRTSLADRGGDRPADRGPGSAAGR